MGEKQFEERPTAQPKSPSISSVLLLGSDVPLDGVDLSAAANLVKEHEHQSPVLSSPSKFSGPPSAEKLHGLRADRKVSVNFDLPVPQKLFARPSSAGQPSADDGFSFGKIDRRSGVNISPPVQKHHDNAEVSQENGESKPPRTNTGKEVSTLSSFDMGSFNILPPHIVKEAQNRAKKSSQASNRQSSIVADGGNERNDSAATTRSGVPRSPAASSRTSPDAAQLALASVEGRIPAKMTPSARASDSPQADCLAGLRHKKRPTADDAPRLKNSIVREDAQKLSSDALTSIENPEADVSNERLLDEPRNESQHVASTMANGFNDRLIVPNGRRSMGPIVDNSQTPKSALPSMGNCSEEDLFVLLLNKSRQQKRSNIRTTARQKQMAITINQLCNANERYQSQLNEANELQSQHVATIKEQERASEDIKTRFRTLKNFVKGLTNDMESVRKESDTISKSQSEVEKFRSGLVEEMREVRMGNDKSTRRMTQMRDTIAELHNSLESAGVANEQLQIAIKLEEGRLQEEKEKTSRLQQEIESKTVLSDQQLGILQSQQKSLLERIEDLPHLIEKLADRLTDATTDPSKLQECLETAKSICASERIIPKDLQNLEASMVTSLTKGIKTCLEGQETETTTFHDTSRASYERIQDQLANLQNNVEVAFGHQDRISALQEANIRLEERLTAKTGAFDDFGVKFDELRERERSLLESIPQMKDELTQIREKGASSPSSPAKGSALDHWKSLVEEYRVKWMSANSEKAKLSKELTDINGKLQEQVAETKDKQRAVECLRDENVEIKKDLDCSEAKLRTTDPQELERLKALAVEQESRIDRTTSELRETTNCLLDNRQTIEHLQIEATTLQNKLQDLQYQHDAALNRAKILEATNAKFQQDLQDIDTLRTQANQVPQLISDLSQEKRANSEKTIVIEQLQQEQQKFRTLKAELANKSSEKIQLAKQIGERQKLEQHIVHLTEDLDQSRSSNAAMSRKSSERSRQASEAGEESRYREGLRKTKELTNILLQLNSELKRKDEENQRLKTSLDEHAKTIDRLRIRTLKVESRSQADVLTQLLAEQTPSIPSPETNGNAIVTPSPANDNGNDITPVPNAPFPERRRSIKNLDSIPIAGDGTSTAIDAFQQESLQEATQMNPDGDKSSESRIGQTSETTDAEPTSEESYKLSSSPCKYRRTSLSGAEHFRRSMNETIDDSQITIMPATPRPLQRRESDIPHTIEEASEVSHSSTQGDEMLLERQSQTDRFADSNDADTHDERESSEVEDQSEDDSPILPKPKSVKATTKSSTAKATRTSLKGVKGVSTRSSGKIVPVDQDQDAQPERSSKDGINAMSAPNTVKRKHQPNSGVKRQLDSDIGTESPEDHPKKVLKRNKSAAGTRTSGSATVSFFDQMPDAASGTPTTPQSHTALPPGSKKGKIGDKSSNGENSSQKSKRKPRKGSKGDQYGKRFG